ncbi:cytochrome P450 [Actinocorallia herbida]|uniref:Cytochrome P450 n=1 Tax=Actinocorallia herbida TaxID=58109 RepID=A0A3N1CY78_9ACTN|nr:cytochrome P450 [Actinocorallia herbida]ROO86205.1 cytochrome P450 [Actinocorallia herbida]
MTESPATRPCTAGLDEAEARTFPFHAPDRLNVDPAFAELREKEPLCPVRLPYGEPAWLVTRHEDVKTVLADPRFSRAASVEHDEPRMRPYEGLPDSIMALDPPEHTRLRGSVAKAFTARRVELLRPRTRAIADELVDRMLAEGPPADLVADFALPLPVTVICELLGVPYADRGEFRQWSEALLSTTKYTEAEIMDASGQLLGYMGKLVAEHRRAPQDDLLSALVAARDERDRLTERELVVLGVSILVAGHETTATQIPNFVYTLLAEPARLAALREHPEAIPHAVEELMRYVPLGSGAAIPRYAKEDVELSGGTVCAGDAVLVALSSANRDPSVYPDPDRLDLSRAETSHLGFGHGPHHCLGAQLARMELQVALETLIGRLPGLRFADSAGDVVWKSAAVIQGPERMPIAWDVP